MAGFFSPDTQRQVRLSPAYADVVRHWPARSVALACSGGVDSTALLLLASLAASRGDIPPFVGIHVNHRTRIESREEAAFVARLCRDLRRPLVRTAVQEWGADSSLPREAALRRARYDALALVLQRLGHDAVVTAHTLDDQVETILMRLLSGAGSLAAAGMRLRQEFQTESGSIQIIRPLLNIPRSDLEQVLDACGVQPCLDPTNADVRFRRNALRHRVIPELRAHAPGFEHALVRSVSIAARDAEAVDALAAEAYRQLARAEGDTVKLDRRLLVELHPAVAGRIIQRAARELMGSDTRELSFERVESVRRAAAGRTGAMVELPYGVVAQIERATVRLQRRDDHDHVGRS